MHVSNLTLTNFRNYGSLSLSLGAGISCFQGLNGQGKSNLLEAIYLLSIGKSLRTNRDRDLLPRGLQAGGGYMQVAGVFQSGAITLKAQVDMQLAGSQQGQGQKMKKSLHINGERVKALDFIGCVKMVLFEVGDVEIVLGAPAMRRRYLDIMITQMDRGYLKTLQRYNKVVFNRNRLLRGLKQRRTSADELDYWDERLVLEGQQVVAKRLAVLQALSGRVGRIYAELTGGKQIRLTYHSGLEYAWDAPNLHTMAQATLEAGLKRYRTAEIARPHTLIGPHRDDVLIRVGGVAAADLSRGEARLVTLALKLGEAEQVASETGQKPLIALDDAFSELDLPKRQILLRTLEQYEQILLTSAEVDDAPQGYATLQSGNNFWVANGAITAQKMG